MHSKKKEKVKQVNHVLFIFFSFWLLQYHDLNITLFGAFKEALRMPLLPLATTITMVLTMTAERDCSIDALNYWHFKQRNNSATIKN